MTPRSRIAYRLGTTLVCLLPVCVALADGLPPSHQPEITSSRTPGSPSPIASPADQDRPSEQLASQAPVTKTYSKLIEKYVSRCRYRKLVARFYAERGYSLAFHDELVPNQNAKDLVASLGTLGAEGIDPKSCIGHSHAKRSLGISNGGAKENQHHRSPYTTRKIRKKR